MTSLKFETPILFLIFNRLDTTKLVFESIRKIKPLKLYIAADGPRTYKPNEAEICQITRNYVINNIDWNCEVKTLFREENLGCGIAVSDAITWFFSYVKMGIILEDDCLPSDSFFRFCESMLIKHENSDEIMHINGTWYLENEEYEYIYSKHPFVWGWATWRRAWNKYNLKLQGDSLDIIEKTVFNNLKSNYQTTIWLNNFSHLLVKGWSFTWDYQWIYTIWKNNGLAITPTKNLVSNIGFDENGTHTIEKDHHLSNVPTLEYQSFNTDNVGILNKERDKRIFDHYFLEKSQNTLIHKNNIYDIIKIKIKSQLRKLIVKIIPEILEHKANNVIYDSHISKECKVYEPYIIQNCRISSYSYIARNSIINNTYIGKYCSIGPNVISGWGKHPYNGISTSPMFYSTMKQNGYSLTTHDKYIETDSIIIGNDVFIGMNVTILDGITIGDGAVIGAGAVVSKDIPPYAIAIGNPIKIIKYRFTNDQIEKLLKIKWWEWDEKKINNIEKYFFEIEEFINNNLK